MKKLSTLFKKDPNDLGRVINEVNPENEWVFTKSKGTRKLDGTACAIIDGELYKRYDAKIDKKLNLYKKPVPEGAIPCQEADVKSGHHPHWVKCDRNNKADKYHFEGFDYLEDKEDSTYELIGPKVQGNPEGVNRHLLIKHGSIPVTIPYLGFVSIKEYLLNHDIEGIVFHEVNGNRMCKIRKSDFGIKR